MQESSGHHARRERGSRVIEAARPARSARVQYEAWNRRATPAVEMVREGVWSIPTAIPDNPLRYVMAYAIATADGLVLIDTGWDSPESWTDLTDGIDQTGHTVEDVTDVLLTHSHLDHHGLTGRVVERSGARVHMHALESSSLMALQGASGRGNGWFTQHGMPEDPATVTEFENHAGYFIAAYTRMKPGDLDLVDLSIPVGALPSLRAIWTPGHTAGHMSFLLEDEKLLFSGDHLLPRITPSVNWMSGQLGNPLGDYLASLARVAELDADEVLPAHEYRFEGAVERAGQLLLHHSHRLEEIECEVDDGATTWQITRAISWSRGWETLTGPMRQMAMSETLAHLEHLEFMSRVHRITGSPIRWATTA
ncbi:MBL fold metallo-hydrolase [Arthrobacter sp. 3Tela_A]|uniref:MBL fold metallo-hydrolase n=1 Tax=Arthrobacter sp. 3Tela_A TaxID=3093743 RepID=UPI003BB7B98C